MLLYDRPKECSVVHIGYYEEGWFLLLLPSILVETKRSLGVVELVLRLHHEDFNNYRSQYDGPASKEG